MTGFGSAVAVMVTGIRLDWVGMRLFIQALLYVTAPAWLAGNKKMAAAANDSRATNDLLRRLETGIETPSYSTID
jgi:hypothetical protein